jgi:alpha-amylase
MAKLLVRTGPSCDYQNYQNTTACTLNLPDIRTESTQDVDLPPFLVENGKRRTLRSRNAELESFFKRMYPKTPLLHHKMVNRLYHGLWNRWIQ